MTGDRHNRLGGVGRIVGMGALACIACCVGPILGLLGTIGVATLRTRIRGLLAETVGSP
jgi:hypothetical protein